MLTMKKQNTAFTIDVKAVNEDTNYNIKASIFKEKETIPMAQNSFDKECTIMDIKMWAAQAIGLIN